MQNNPKLRSIQKFSTSFNKHSGYLVQLFHRGILESGGTDLLDKINVFAICSLVQNLCNVSCFFLEHANSLKVSNLAQFQTIEYKNNTTDYSSLTISVHDSDVTMKMMSYPSQCCLSTTGCQSLEEMSMTLSLIIIMALQMWKKQLQYYYNNLFQIIGKQSRLWAIIHQGRGVQRKNILLEEVKENNDEEDLSAFSTMPWKH